MEPSPPPLILASASPRRAALLSMLGLQFRIHPAHVPEHPLGDEDAAGHVERLARDKAAAVARERPDALVLAGDTVVVLDGRLLGKPGGPDDAMGMLLQLAGRTHTVYTGLALAAPGRGVLCRVESTRVTFRDFGPEEARAYVTTGEPLDKAGAYGIQGPGASLVREIAGDYYTVVGLPVYRLVELLEEAGWRYAFGRLTPARS